MAQIEQLRAEIPDRITFDLGEFKAWLIGECLLKIDEIPIDHEIYHG